MMRLYLKKKHNILGDYLGSKEKEEKEISILMKSSVSLVTVNFVSPFPSFFD
jgi:hypothetical protein